MSKFDLLGESEKYDPHILGNYKQNTTTLSITRIDNYKVRVDYLNPEEYEEQITGGVGRFVRNKGNLYAVVKDGEEYYFVAKILGNSASTLEINILDEDDIDIEFNSEKEFTKHVFNDRGVFSEKYDLEFRRQ